MRLKKHVPIGYHASHEQHTPGELLSHVQAAEAAGFDAAMCSDHFLPWSDQQGHSGFAWSWLGAAMQATRLPFGVVNAPGYRYHPAIIAQAAATLQQMFPGRFWVAIGSGEALNEHITGEAWPPKHERNERLKECADIFRALWAGETVNHRGQVTVLDACLYTRPETPPRLVGAAITPKTARWMGSWVDALITAAQPPDALRELIDAFREGGGEGKPLLLQSKLSFAPTHEEALREAHVQWRTNIFKSHPLADLRLPAEFEAIAEYVTPKEVESRVHVSSDPEQHVEWILRDLELGFDELYLHNVNLRQREFIEAFGEKVLPAVRREMKGAQQ